MFFHLVNFFLAQALAQALFRRNNDFQAVFCGLRARRFIVTAEKFAPESCHFTLQIIVLASL